MENDIINMGPAGAFNLKLKNKAILKSLDCKN